MIKQVLKCCPHYDDIITYDFTEDDSYSLYFIEYYQNYIYSITHLDDKTKSILNRLDFVMNKYISDNKFRKEFKDKIREISIEAIIQFYNAYEEHEIKNIDNTIWI